MFIDCISCSKKFEVNSSLIPENGRTIQCGSCNHVWFYKPQINAQKNETTSDVNENQNDTEVDISLINNQLDQNHDNQEEKKIFNTNEKLISETIEDKNKTKKTFGISKFLSYLLVSIISFIALIIVLDTFKSPLSNIIPGLEIFLYNFFETLKDLYLFIKNLFI
ncbi:zinc-ribbon domain-containing protein [Candidatus Pelagibacter sp.]|uniref:zinc-ribbon domain-containing protein n=1 Tax=Candidatus Pelagibacter sp. TaxID=2024849 RepID=UPI003F861A92